MPNIGTSSSNSLSALTAKINAQAEAERQALEHQVETEFRNLCASLRRCVTDALSTMEKDITEAAATTRARTADQIKLLSGGFMKRWFMCALMGLALVGGMALGGWSLTTLATSRINSIRQDLADLNQRKAALETTVSQLQSQTWNLELTETQDGRFIILPPKVTPKTGWTFGKRQAVKLE